MISIATFLVVLIALVLAVIAIIGTFGERMASIIPRTEIARMQKKVDKANSERDRYKQALMKVEKVPVEVKEIGDWISLIYGGTYDD